MTHVWAVILGLVQGFAEFLPVSSTAHLKLVPWAFQLRDPMLSSMQFDIALHAGSFIAIVLALWRDWVDLLVGAIGGPSRSAVGTGVDVPSAGAGVDPLRDKRFARKFILFLLLTSVPGAIAGVTLEKYVEYLSTPVIPGTVAGSGAFHYAPLLLGIALMVFGVLLWAVDRFVSTKEQLQTMTWWKALLIGIAQATALIPGVSRSGSTMMAGRALGLERDAVARYSFMAAMPIIGGAAVFGLKDVALSTLLSLDWVLGFVASALSSVLVMRWMLAYIKRHSFSVFMWYRIAAGAAVIALFLVRG